jgi:hypothetical protein
MYPCSGAGGVQLFPFLAKCTIPVPLLDAFRDGAMTGFVGKLEVDESSSGQLVAALGWWG